jgi:hypothetical protein
MTTARPTKQSNRPAYYFLGRSAMRWQVALDARSTAPRRSKSHNAEKQPV